MTSIKLTDVSVQFPLYDAWNRSFKHRLVNTTTFGGLFAKQTEKIHIDAVSEISLEIGAGDRVALLGGNGAGKTTLLRLLSGLLHPIGGTVEIEGQAMAVLEAGFGYSPEMTAYDTVRLMGILRGKSDAEICRLKEAIAEFSTLGSPLSMPLRNLTPAQLFMLGASFAFAFDNRIILFDEAIEKVSTDFVLKVRDHINNDLPEDRIVIVAGRMRSIFDGLCNKALILEKGKVLDYGEYDEVVTRHGADYLL